MPGGEAKRGAAAVVVEQERAASHVRRCAQEAYDESQGLPLSLDADAKSASRDLPAFLARPQSEPVYHGFQVLEGVEVDGFRLGTISALGPADYGDAFIVAPDGARAGLVWQVGNRQEAHQIRPFEPGRWGVWSLDLPSPMRSIDDARRNLEALVPRVREKWEAWRAEQRGEQPN